MKEILPEKLKILALQCPFPLYAVGGTCRDYLAGLKADARDYDICAPADAERLIFYAEKAGFAVSAVYKNTGTVKLKADGESYEFTSFRSDEYVRGCHNPVKIFFTDDIVKDARRRDFKCNAVYYDIAAEKFCDPLGGIADIAAKRIDTVAPAEKVFSEDGLRLMRLCRQAAQTGFVPTEECQQGARTNRALLRDISAERIGAELDLILHADGKYGVRYGHYAGLKLLDGTGVLDEILPELALGRGMGQRADFHDHDVLEHSLRCAKYADGSIRLAALLHDVGKPKQMLEGGKFALHEEAGALIADEVCTRLKVSAKRKQNIVELVRYHMYDYDLRARESRVRKFIVNHYALIGGLLLLKQADYSACRDDTGKAPCVEKWENILAAMRAEGVPFTVKDLAVRGDALIGAGISPDKTASVLKYLLGECALDHRLNQRDKLIKLALRYAVYGQK